MMDKSAIFGALLAPGRANLGWVRRNGSYLL